MVTTGSGAGYRMRYDTGSRDYVVTAPPATSPAGSPADVRINEYLMAPQSSGTTEWVELYNPTGSAQDVGGLFLDDVAAGGGAPRQIPAGTSIT